MSKWNHSLCDECWAALEGARIPCRVKDGPETCCRCGEVHTSGIYQRRDPLTYLCNGTHALAEGETA